MPMVLPPDELVTFSTFEPNALVKTTSYLVTSCTDRESTTYVLASIVELDCAVTYVVGTGGLTVKTRALDLVSQGSSPTCVRVFFSLSLCLT